MNIVYYDIHPAPKKEKNLLCASAVPLNALLRVADVVTLHLRADDTTKDIIGAREFAQMKHGAILINTARATLVDQDALLASLSSGHLSGVGLDVFSSEPPRPDDPLFSFPRVVATPHSAGSTRDAYEQVLRNCVSNIRRALSGEDIQWSANGIVRRIMKI